MRMIIIIMIMIMVIMMIMIGGPGSTQFMSRWNEDPSIRSHITSRDEVCFRFMI